MTASKTGSDVSVGVATYVVSPSINSFSPECEFLAENSTGKFVCEPCSTSLSSSVIDGFTGYPIARCSPLSGKRVTSTPALFSKFTLMYRSEDIVVAVKYKINVH